MRRTFVIAFLALAVFVGTAAAQTTTPVPSPNQGAFDDPRVRVTGSTLQEAEQKLFAPQGGLAQGNSKFDARFRDLSLTQADRQRLLQDIQKLRTIPEGSRVRYEGLMDGQRFHVDVWNRKGELDVRMNGVQFGSREEAQAFIDSLRQAGADQIRIKGTIDGQRFHASFQDHNGRVKQQFRFSSLSPGNQKIVQALCAAQKNGCGGTGSLTLDQIAAMKPKGEGWGEFFRQHQDLFPGAKNLGEAVSNFERSQKASSTASGSTSTTGKEKSEGAVSKGRDDQERSGPTTSGGSSGSHGLGGGASGMGSSSGQLGGLGGRGGGRR